MNNYIKRGALFLGAFALVGASAMAEDGAWRNINYKITAPSFVEGWSGNFSAVNEGIGENYNGAFEAYQVIPNLPAGKYTLTCNAFYRYADNALSQENMKDGKNHNAYIFLGTAKTAVEGLFDKNETAPNNLGEAKTAFEAGKYVNTVEFDHKGGDLRFGIGNTGGRNDEWTAFDNFVLAGPNGAVAVPNGDFEKADAAAINWDFDNVDGSAKLPDTPLKTVQTKQDKQNEYNGKVTGVFRKTNASVYNFGTPVQLEAGKYRVGVQSFFRMANGNHPGAWVGVKTGWQKNEGATAWDIHTAGTEDPAKWAYVYAASDIDGKPLGKEDGESCIEEGGFFVAQNIKCLFDEKLDVYPDNEPFESGDPDENGYGWTDSGFEQYSAKCFINNPELYRNYVEFELKAPAKVWIGLGIDARPSAASDGNNHYWNPARDFTLEQWDANAAGVDNIIAEEDVNAPAEYYNLQGVRVANPTPGLYIVKQGKKVSKQVIR